MVIRSKVHNFLAFYSSLHFIVQHVIDKKLVLSLTQLSFPLVRFRLNPCSDQTDSQADTSRRKFAKPELASAWKFTQAQKVVIWQIQMTCDQLVSTCVRWPNGEKLASTCVRIWARPNSVQVIAINASGWPKGTQVENLRWLVSIWPGLNLHFTSYTWPTDLLEHSYIYLQHLAWP